MAHTEADYWSLIHAERARLADLLDGLNPQQWQADSMCMKWTVEQVTAHLTAAAHTGTWVWMRCITFAGFNTDRHNARRLNKHIGDTAQETGKKFRESIALTIAPTKDYAAWLGEVIVHGQDIARPLGIPLKSEPKAVREVAEFFVTKDFAVNSRQVSKGLRFEASDAEFSLGSGPIIHGPILSLVMLLAGRKDYCIEVEGDGVAELRRRIA